MPMPMLQARVPEAAMSRLATRPFLPRPSPSGWKVAARFAGRRVNAGRNSCQRPSAFSTGSATGLPSRVTALAHQIRLARGISVGFAYSAAKPEESTSAGFHTCRYAPGPSRCHWYISTWRSRPKRLVCTPNSASSIGLAATGSPCGEVDAPTVRGTSAAPATPTVTVTSTSAASQRQQLMQRASSPAVRPPHERSRSVPARCASPGQAHIPGRG